MSATQIDEDLLKLLPHRPPMLLLSSLVSVSQTEAAAQAMISDSNPFYISGQGVPSWIALEIMGQTAALIAGYQQSQGTLETGTGFLLGCRQLVTTVPWLQAGSLVTATCTQSALIEGGLATFDCHLKDADNVELVSATLSVFRQSANHQSESSDASSDRHTSTTQ